MTTSTRWPGDDELHQLLAGEIDPLRGAEIEALVESDVALRQHLEDLAGGSSWIGRASNSSAEISGLGASTPRDDDAGLAGVLQGLKAQTAATITSDTPRATTMMLRFLDPSTRPGSLGRLGEYEVLEHIGSGGFGVVLKALDPKLNRQVAIKVLAPHLAEHATARQRFLREAQAAAPVSHNNVVTIHAIEEKHQPPFIVMEYVDGMSLQQLIDREGPLTISKLVRIGAQTAAGLAAAHKQGLIHRDIKPANILLENGVQRAKLTDFGLARAADDASLTQSGIVVGSPQYMAPEQARGESVDYRSDLFSLGSVLYSMCTGRPAFRAESTVAVLKRVCDDEPRPIREVAADVPTWLAAIVAKLMAKRREERFQTAAEVAELLERCLAHLQQPNLVPLPDEALALERAFAASTRSAAAPAVVPPVVGEFPAYSGKHDGGPSIGDYHTIVSARQRLRGPGIGLIVLGILNLFLLGGFAFVMTSHTVVREVRPGTDAPPMVSINYFGMLLIVLMFVSALGSVGMIVGGVQMQRLRMWPLGIIAGILTMFALPSCPLGFFIGLWAIVELLSTDVRRGFALHARSGHRAIAEPPAKVSTATSEGWERVRQQLQIPGIGVIFAGILNWVGIGICGMVYVGMPAGHVPLYLAMFVLAVLTCSSIVMVFGGQAMRRLTNWPVAVLAALCAILVGPGNWIGLVFGLWALILLFRRETRAAFEATSSIKTSAQALAPQKPGVSPTGAPARPLSPAALVILIVAILFGAPVLLALIAGTAYWLMPIGSQPDAVAEMSDTGRITIMTDIPDLHIAISGVFNFPATMHATTSGDSSQGEEFTFHQTVPSGDYVITASDEARRQVIFQEQVRVHPGQQKIVRVVYHDPPERTITLEAEAQIARQHITATTLSRDGRWLARASSLNQIAVNDLESGKTVATVDLKQPLYRIALSPDGKLLAYWGRLEAGAPLNQMKILLHDVASKQTRELEPAKTADGRFQSLSNVEAIEFSPDGKFVCAASSYNWTKQREGDSTFMSIVHRWDAATGMALAPLMTQEGKVRDIVFPDGNNEKLLLVSNDDILYKGYLGLWDWGTAAPVARSTYFDCYFDAAALTPQAGWVYAAQYMPSRAGRFDASNIYTFATRTEGITKNPGGYGFYYEPARVEFQPRAKAMTISPDGSVLALLADLTKVELYAVDSTRLKKLGELRGDDLFSNPALRFTPDNRLLRAAGSEGKAMEWNVAKFTSVGRAAKVKPVLEAIPPQEIPAKTTPPAESTPAEAAPAPNR